MKQSKYYFAVFLIIVLSIFLRFFLLGNQSLWYDEGVSLFLSDGTSFQENLSKILGREAGDKYQPLYYLLLFYWRSAFGNTEFAIRSLSALLGVGSVIAIFFTTLRIYGKNHAIWSSLILGFSSFCVYYSQETRPYSLLIFLASLQLYFFSQVFNEDDNNEIIWRLFFGVFTTIGIFSSVLIGIFSAALCLSHAIVYRKLRRWLQWWLPAGVFSSPIILLYLSSPAVAEPTKTIVTRFSGFPIVQNAIFVLYGILVGTTYGPPQEQLRGEDKLQVVLGYWPHLIILLIVGTVIFIALVNTLLRHRNRSRYHRADSLFACLFVTSFFLGLLLAAVTKMNWVPRHSFYLCLSLAILIPSAFSQRHKRRTKLYRVSRYARMAVTFLIVINIYSLFNYYFNKDYWRDDYRSAAQYLIKNRDSSAQSILLWGSPRLLKYYGDKLTLDGRKFYKTENFTAEKVRNLTSNADTVFIVVNREFYLHKKGLTDIEGKMNDLYDLNSKVDFLYFNIYRFTRKEQGS